jgi:hypothetical protein
VHFLIRCGLFSVDEIAVVDNLQSCACAKAAQFETGNQALGFFVPQKPNPVRIGDQRLVSTYPAIWHSQADFIDLHAYPGSDFSLKQHVENFQINGMQEKPIVMGEFGAYEGSFASVDAAARALMAWQVESCQYGFDGWLLWTWDNALSGDGKIERVLAPVVRPDPSAGAPPGLFENNIALGKNVTASRSLPDQPPSNAVDGTGALWGAGSHPPQWIQIDLGKPSTIMSIRLTVDQYPEGDTLHQIWVGGPNDPLHQVNQFAGHTAANQILEFRPATPLTGVQYVRVVSLRSPSWVAWKEIEVIAP